MVCLYCGSKTGVSNSRLQRRNNTVWRRRRCLDCEATVTTIERIEPTGAIMVIDGKRHEPFSRDRLFISVYTSCRHRKTALEDATALTETILSKLYTKINDASLTLDEITKTTYFVLEHFDLPSATHYRAYHPLLADLSQIKP
ncbi:hypothetical protein EKI60_04425 [Candidatus Saccharibacteria bacterium]|nr:MAG: hypothetical protein EKI60_04425 [Candidatus Saccharibacteria bacterium]